MILTRCRRSRRVETGSDNNRFPLPSAFQPESGALVAREPRAELHVLVRDAQEFASGCRAASTQRAYRSDWGAFMTWCSRFGLTSLPASPETVATYVAAMASSGRRPSTIARALVAISTAHRFGGQPSPTSSPRVRETVRGLRRRLGVAQKQKAPVLTQQLKRMVAEVHDDLSGMRDRALLLLGFAGGFRRSELVALDLADLEFTEDGLIVCLHRTKTDQEGAGRRVGIPYGSAPQTCPVRSLRRWLTAAGITSGPVFRAVNRWGAVSSRRLTAQVVALVVKEYAAKIGLDEASFAGHSLRAGLATSAARAGKSERSIMATTGHTSVEMVRRYVRQGSLFSDNAASGLL